MTTASLAASDPGAAVRIDRLFLGLALAATAILIALVSVVQFTGEWLSRRADHKR